MKVKEIIKKLSKLDPELEIVVDGDDRGYYNLENVEVWNEPDSNQSFVNLISSNED